MQTMTNTTVDREDIFQILIDPVTKTHNQPPVFSAGVCPKRGIPHYFSEQVRITFLYPEWSAFPR